MTKSATGNGSTYEVAWCAVSDKSIRSTGHEFSAINKALDPGVVMISSSLLD